MIKTKQKYLLLKSQIVLKPQIPEKLNVTINKNLILNEFIQIITVQNSLNMPLKIM